MSKNIATNIFPSSDNSEKIFKKEVPLPLLAAKIIDSSKFRGKRKEKIALLCHIVLRNQIKTGRHRTEFTPLPVTYLKKSLGQNYHLVLNDARKIGLLETNHYYYFFQDERKGHCKAHRVAHQLFGEDGIKMMGVEKLPAPQTFTEIRTTELLRESETLHEGAMLRMEQWINHQEYMAKISVDGKISTDITVAFCRIGNENHKFIKMEKLKEIAKRKKHKLFQKGKKVRMCGEEKFHEDKANEIRESWGRAIEDLKNGNVYARIGKNGRIFSNISNFPEPLMEFIEIEGEKMAAIDVKNCQMMMMGKWMRDDKDGGNSSVVSKERFADLASTGKIYEKVQEIAGLETRDEAKIGTFRALYSSYRAKSRVKSALTQEFPGLVEELDALKKQNGQSFLADTMQQMESSVMVNRILHDLLCMGYKVFSKHDSILCKWSQVEEIKNFMTEVLNELVGEHRLEVKYYGK